MMSSATGSATKPQKKMWKKMRDAVNRTNGIVRRISIRKSGRVKKYPSSSTRAPDFEPEEKE